MSDAPLPDDLSGLKSLLQASQARTTGHRRPLAVTAALEMECRHCRETKPEKRRGLCRDCYDEPAIRNLYPSEHRGGKDTDRGFATPKATDARPGSAAKVLVLIERRRRGQALWNKQFDAKSEADEAFADMLASLEDEPDQAEPDQAEPEPAEWRLPRYGRQAANVA
jgi:hypothetical protein